MQCSLSEESFLKTTKMQCVAPHVIRCGSVFYIRTFITVKNLYLLFRCHNSLFSIHNLCSYHFRHFEEKALIWSWFCCVFCELLIKYMTMLPDNSSSLIEERVLEQTHVHMHVLGETFSWEVQMCVWIRKMYAVISEWDSVFHSIIGRKNAVIKFSGNPRFHCYMEYMEYCYAYFAVVQNLRIWKRDKVDVWLQGSNLKKKTWRELVARFLA